LIGGAGTPEAFDLLALFLTCGYIESFYYRVFYLIIKIFKKSFLTINSDISREKSVMFGKISVYVILKSLEGHFSKCSWAGLTTPVLQQ
jgi:hypothetical protein